MAARTTPAYHREPFRTTLDATVVAVGASGGTAWVATDDTVLYPGGGGQPADRGTLAGTVVTGVARIGSGWRHDLDAAEPPLTAGPAPIAIDWSRRFDHMQQHTAQHLLSAVAQDRWGWPTTAFHLGEERSDVELDAPSIPEEELAALEDAVMGEVRQGRPITTRFVSVDAYRALGTRSRGLPEGHEGDVRLVEIQGVDLTACGGTHLSSTAQIEAVKLLGSEGMRGGTRLHWVAGGRTRARLGTLEARADALKRLLAVPEEELVTQAEARLAQLREAERRGRWLEGRLAEETAAHVGRNEGPVIEAHLDGMDASFLKAVLGHLQGELGQRVVLLTAAADGVASFVLAAGEEAAIDVAATGREVADLLEGRGGGAGTIFQGRAGSLSRRNEALEAVRNGLG